MAHRPDLETLELEKGPRHCRGPFFLPGTDFARRAKPYGPRIAFFRSRERATASPSSRPKNSDRDGYPSFRPAKPRNALPARVETSIGSDETNQIIDELSLQPVIYRLASPRRRGTIGGGSTTGAPQEIVFGCKWRISVVHRIWTRKNPCCAQKKCPVDGFRC